MAKQVCIFVDGENFRKSIVGLFNNFNQDDYLPHNADWTGLFNWCIDRNFSDGERLRTYWYVVQRIDFFPYKLPITKKEPDKLKYVLSKNKDCKKSIGPLQNEELLEKMETIRKGLIRRQDTMLKRLRRWTGIQDAIAHGSLSVEFRRAGGITYDTFTGNFGREKAVDVKMATDMIELRDIYDIAVIFSGDQDFVPAVQALKDSGKRVFNVVFKTKTDKFLPGGAWRLNEVTDNVIEITYKELAKFLKIRV